MGKHKGRLELTWTDKDKTLLSASDGRYEYSFVDPSDHRAREVRLLEHVERIDHPTPDDRPEDLPEPTSDNLLITGDAMHALEALSSIPEYAQNYLGQVKLVYIDPPFNTGQAFPNGYEDNIAHSVWLTMLRDRLRQIKPLLAENGSVWVHLDDVEVHRCRVVMDEELGEDNFVGEVVWQKADGSRNDARKLSISHDVILVYRASSKWELNRTPRTAEDNLRFSSPDDDPRPWFDDNPTAPSAASHQGMVYAIQHPITHELIYPGRSRCWWTDQTNLLAVMSEYAPYEVRDLEDAAVRADICGVPEAEIRAGVGALMLVDPESSEASARARLEEGVWPAMVLRSGGDGGLGRKAYIPEGGMVPGTWWPHTVVGHNRRAKAEAKALFKGKSAFATPKPEALLQRVLQITTNPGDIVLDCFAGSGTTAAVAHKMGRRWVAVELLDETANEYTKPRLAKVVRGQDPKGISTSTKHVVAKDVELPGGMQPEQAQLFQTMLRKAVKGASGSGAGLAVDKELAKLVRRAKKEGTSPLDDDETKALLALVKKFGGGDVSTELDVMKPVQSKLNRATKTRKEVTTVWHGGGGFTNLKVGPSMFTEIDGMILLADWATQGDLARALCAQIGIRYEPEGIFAGRNGRTRIVVIDGLVGQSTVEAVLDRLEASETVHLWATQADDDAAGALASARPGSRLSRIPETLIDQYRRAAGRPANDSEENH